MIPLLFVALAIALYLTWCVGVNTVGTVLGVTTGSGVLKLKAAVLGAGLFTVLGIMFTSERIINTLGNTLVHLNNAGVVAVFVVVGILLMVTTSSGIPIFETYLIMGALAGFSIMQGLPLDVLMYEKILASMFVSPFAAMACGFIAYKIILKLGATRIKSVSGRELLEAKFIVPAIMAMAVLCFALGGNSVGVAIGVLGGKIDMVLLLVLGSAAVIMGVLTWSYKVAKTVGLKLTDLSPSRGFSVHLAAGLTLMGFLYMSIPVSTTQTLIGATIGVGLARGRVEPGTVKTIAFSWVVGLPAAIGMAALLGWLL